MEVTVSPEDIEYAQRIIRISLIKSGFKLKQNTKVFLATSYELGDQEIAFTIEFVRVFDNTQYQDSLEFETAFPIEILNEHMSINLKQLLSPKEEFNCEQYLNNCIAQTILKKGKVHLHGSKDINKATFDLTIGSFKAKSIIDISDPENFVSTYFSFDV